MNSKFIIFAFLFAFLFALSFVSNAEVVPHYTCSFGNSVFVDNSGTYKAKVWESNGFTIQNGWVILDSGNLKLKLNTNIQKFDILRGGEYKKGYQFSLENNNFIYVMLMVPLSKSWTVTGTCKKDKK